MRRSSSPRGSSSLRFPHASLLALSPFSLALSPFHLAPVRRLSPSPLFSDPRPDPVDHSEAYPDLEYVDYDSSEVDFGDNDDYFPRLGADEATDREVEAMREARRVQNDVYQYNTYFTKFWEGREWRGEWTTYETSTFLAGYEDVKDANGLPKIMKSPSALRVLSTAARVVLDPSAPDYSGEHLSHAETSVPPAPSSASTDADTGFGRDAPRPPPPAPAPPDLPPYVPARLSPADFRGTQGNQCVGPAFTVAAGVPLLPKAEGDDGPFRELRTEVGISSDDLRLRLKLDYRTKEGEDEGQPRLHLKTATVCREKAGEWPGPRDLAFHGRRGARGGLFDPPPVGEGGQERQYMMLDLEGFATALFPHTIDQDPNAYDGKGWVATLDWSPGKMRYQADRKFEGGTGVKGLRSLELTEMMSQDAEQYKPEKGPADLF